MPEPADPILHLTDTEISLVIPADLAALLRRTAAHTDLTVQELLAEGAETVAQEYRASGITRVRRHPG